MNVWDGEIFQLWLGVEDDPLTLFALDFQGWTQESSEQSGTVGHSSVT